MTTMLDSHLTPQPSTDILQTYALRMLWFHDNFRDFERQLDDERAKVVVLSLNNTKTQEHEDVTMILHEARVFLQHLVKSHTDEVERQIMRPNTALGRSAEGVNKRVEKDLKKLGEALIEMQYLTRNW